MKVRTYHLQPTEAVRFQGDTDAELAEVADWCGGELSEIQVGSEVTPFLRIRDQHGNVVEQARSGEWVARRQDGSFVAFTDEQFTERFTPDKP